MEERISIVLPTYNGANCIEKSINSIIQQTFTNWELIIVNDCSTDNTLEIINEYAQRDDRIKVINNKENKKLPASLNIGFVNATGDLLTWTSDDNAYHEDALEEMVRVIHGNPEIDMVYADFDVVDMSGNILWSEKKKAPSHIRYINTVGACFLYKKSLANIIGEYDTKLFLAEDYEYWIKAYLNGKLFHISKSLYNYGWHDKSLTATRKSEIKIATFKAKKKHEEELLARCDGSAERNAYFWTMLSHLDASTDYKTQRKKYYKIDRDFAIADRKKRLVEQKKWILNVLKAIVYKLVRRKRS